MFFFGGSLFFLDGLNFDLEKNFIFRRYYGASRIWSPASWPVALIRPVILRFEFQISEFGVFLRSFLTPNLALPNECYQNRLVFHNFFVYRLKIELLMTPKTVVNNMIISKTIFRILKTEQKVKNERILFLVSTLRTGIFMVRQYKLILIGNDFLILFK